MKNSKQFAVALIFVVIGLSLFYHKLYRLNFPIVPDVDGSSWYVELEVKVTSSKSFVSQNAKKENPLEIKLVDPPDDIHFAVTNTQVISKNFGKRKTKDKQNSYWRLTKRAPQPSEIILMRYNLFKLENTADVFSFSDFDNERLSLVKSNRDPNPDDVKKTMYQKVDEIIDKAFKLSADKLSFADQLSRLLIEDKETTEFLVKESNSRDVYSLMSKLLAVQNIESRVANGFLIKQESDFGKIVRWVDVLSDKVWYKYSLGKRLFDETTDTYTWWYGDKRLLEASNAENVEYHITIKPVVDSSLTRTLWMTKNKKSFFQEYALHTLPLAQQNVLRVLLLLPLGALIVSFFRLVLGISTIGTFMPVLIALAFRETGLIYGITFFSVIISVGMLLRSYINRLRLLMVPRLTAILTSVVMLIIIFMLTNKDQSIPLGISIALFPVVIITMFIERLSTVLDEKGTRHALLGSIGTLLVSCFIYIIIINRITQHVLFTFPELLLVILGLSIFLGRYTGYRLSELWRFRQILLGEKDAEA